MRRRNLPAAKLNLLLFSFENLLYSRRKINDFNQEFSDLILSIESKEVNQMRSNILFFALPLIVTSILTIGMSVSEREHRLPVNSIVTHVTYTPCYDPDWHVTVSLNGGGYVQSCYITDASCKCVVNNAPQGYYTITVDNGQCTGVEYNVYHPAVGTPTDVYVDSDLNCYK